MTELKMSIRSTVPDDAGSSYGITDPKRAEKG